MASGGEFSYMLSSCQYYKKVSEYPYPQGPLFNTFSEYVLPSSPFHHPVFVTQGSYLEGHGGVERCQTEDFRLCNQNGIDVVQLFPEIRRKRFLFIKYRRIAFGLNFNDARLLSNVPFPALKKILDGMNRCRHLISFNVHHLRMWRKRHIEYLLGRSG